MQFTYPKEFEIPDEWWAQAGMSNFRPSDRSYVACPIAASDTRIVPIDLVEPPERAANVREFDRDRMISVLRGMRTCEPISPVQVHEPLGSRVHRYAVRDGFHRFYASVAAGFICLPVEVLPYFDIRWG